MAEPSLRDHAAAVAGELLQLTDEAVKVGDTELAVPLKETRRLIRSLAGEHPSSQNAFLRLRARLAEREGLAASCLEAVRAQYKTRNEHVELREGFLTEATAALDEREADVAAREKKASPPYRAAFVTAGALLALSGDVVLRLVG
jgi:predicted NACHT family NTPase